MSTLRRRARSTWALAVGVALGSGACFGDWVNAVPRPRRDGPTPTPQVAARPDPPPPTEPCAAYLAEVARRCDAVFDGQLGSARCHPQIIRVKDVFHPDRRATGHRGAPRPPPEACTQYLQALPAAAPSTRAPADLGPSCRAWAERLRERCVDPLSTIPPKLEGCGPGLLAFEGMLGGITFGQPSAYEPQCQREVERLRPRADAPRDSEG